jgi:hypothetical protein
VRRTWRLIRKGEARKLPPATPVAPIRLSLGGAVATVAHLRLAGRVKRYGTGADVVKRDHESAAARQVPEVRRASTRYRIIT